MSDNNFVRPRMHLKQQYIRNYFILGMKITSYTIGNAAFCLKQSVKGLILSAKTSPTGYLKSCRRRPVGDVFDGKDLFVDSHVAPYRRSLADSPVPVGEGGRRR
jgi:hypothetical protein